MAEITYIHIYAIFVKKKNKMANKRVRDNSGKYPYTFKSETQRQRMKELATKKRTTVQALITKALESRYSAVMAGE